MKPLPTLITKQDVIDKFENEKQYANWIGNKVRSGKYMKIRNDLYALVDPSLADIYATRYQIASKISNTSFLCYHSALEYYGLANQVYNDLFVGSLTRFNYFEFQQCGYIYTSIRNDKFVDNNIYEGVRVTSLERTLIDCIDDIDIAGGFQEVLNAFESVRFVDENKLLDVLKDINKVYLYQKAGYLFELYKEDFHISDNFFAVCKSHVTNKVNYFTATEFRNRQRRNKTWNLIVPVYPKSCLDGGFYEPY